MNEIENIVGFFFISKLISCKIDLTVAASVGSWINLLNALR